MGILQFDNYIQLCILLFFIGSIIALGLNKKARLCNYVSNGISIIATALLAFASIMQIMGGKDVIKLSLLKSTLPFIRLEMTIDGLSAIFLLILSLLTICVSTYSIGYISSYYGKRNVGLFYFL